MTTKPLLTTGLTDTGRRRQDNQDTFICNALWSDHRALLVVIDGVGGYAGGAEAAALAAEAILGYMETPTGDPLTMLREAVVHANNQIVRESQREPSLALMCCVLTAAIADADAGRLWFAHVGDTRLYRFRAQELEKITHDHSLVGVREDANQLTESEAMNHPRRNEILRDVGSEIHRVDDPDFLESGETDFQLGDQLLLCSDGLTDMITRAQIRAVLAGNTTPEQQASELILLANEHGGNDNITVVLARYVAPVHASPAVADEPVAPTGAESITADATPVKAAPASRSTGWQFGIVSVGVLLVILGWWWWRPAALVPRPARPDSGTAAVPAKPVDTLSTPVRSLSVTDSLRKP